MNEQFVKDTEKYEVLHERIEVTLNATRRGFVGELKEELEEAGFDVTIEDGTVIHLSKESEY